MGSSNTADLAKVALLSALGSALAGGSPMVPGEGVEFWNGKKIRVPEGMSYQQVRDVIDRAERDAETITGWQRTYKYRPDDGAYAAAQVLVEMFGGAFGERTFSFFTGPKPPQLKTVVLDAAGTSVDVPWEKLSLPTLDKTTVLLGEEQDRDYGRIFHIEVNGPRKYKDEVMRFLDAVGEYLAKNSIYRGKAIVGANKPEFIDLSRFKADQIVFSRKATKLLENTIWLPLLHAAELRSEGIPLKRAVLLHGPYGTGKTSAGMVTAQLGVAEGWTVVFGRSGRDNIHDTLRTAKLYQPAIVVIEDIDNEAGSGDTDKVSQLLEALDGATSKGSEIMMVVTTNHLERIHKGMLRPGRFDAAVEIASLDAEGIERLIKAVAGPKLDPSVDFEKVAQHMAGFFPAFVREALDRARVLAITRSGRDRYVLDTADLSDAADTLQEQLRVMNAADDAATKPTVDSVLREVFRDAADGLGMDSVRDLEDRDPNFWIHNPDKNPVNDE